MENFIVKLELVLLGFEGTLFNPPSVF